MRERRHQAGAGQMEEKNGQLNQEILKLETVDVSSFQPFPRLFESYWEMSVKMGAEEGECPLAKINYLHFFD